ncbi:putative 2-oxoglutarate dehydrogenase E1 component DHKTD1, mitochondrial [Araneus ventricosus]|uniref:Putative 2-oxoglutarate dehydrogenase E1 component DHKTD1, mitochondrial n=1 Tax=Araneus ventricosus TaxID=182803 RepID=A0A4Y2L9R1_ARAVE|nr:putative 2-oxoglutarate dehydrogenase E1 component DHKTD1, mitochondrial [Araneus ventricosus]
MLYYLFQNEGEVTKEEISDMTSNYYNILNENLKLSQTHETKLTGMQVNWKKDSTLKDAVSVWDTGISVDLLKYVGAKSVQLPDNFSIHPTLEKNFVQERLKKLVKGNQIDWATAEALAVGSLLYQDFTEKSVLIKGNACVCVCVPACMRAMSR